LRDTSNSVTRGPPLSPAPTYTCEYPSLWASPTFKNSPPRNVSSNTIRVNSTWPSVPSSTFTTGEPPKPGTAITSSFPSPVTSATATRTPPVNDGSNASTLNRCDPSAFLTTTRGSAPASHPAAANTSDGGGGGGGELTVRFTTSVS